MKKIILCLLLMFPVIVFADCNSSLHADYASYASKITYENDFDTSNMKFSVTFYNVIDGLYFEYNDDKYYPQSNEIKFNVVSQGTQMSIKVFGLDGCSDAVRIISINEPYYNPFYGSSECEGYETKLSYCSSQFLTLPVTRELFDMAKKHMDNGIKQEKEVPIEKEETLIDKIIGFASSWGVKIGLFVITCIATFSYYNDKFRKIKHGI